MKKIPDNAPDLIRWVNYIIHTKPINTIAGVVLSALGVGVSAGGIYLIKYSLSDNSEDIEPPVKESEKPKKPFSIYPTTQECDIIVGQKGVETDEKKLSK